MSFCLQKELKSEIKGLFNGPFLICVFVVTSNIYAGKASIYQL